eukprot:186-Prymnesium_polylepis.1
MVASRLPAVARLPGCQVRLPAGCQLAASGCQLVLPAGCQVASQGSTSTPPSALPTSARS